jgi:thymidylate synthase
MTNFTWENQYLNLLHDILVNGEDRVDRTGTGTRAVFGKQLDINLRNGFPLVTTKKVPFKAVVSELLWFLEGSSDERRLCEIHHGTRDDDKTTIWTANAQADYWKPKAKFHGDLGDVYGVQWRGWETGRNIPTPDKDGHIWHLPEKIDQIAQAIDKIKNNPTDRRILVSAWNVGKLSNMALPPCHMFFQLYVSNDRRLSLQMYQRSVDTMLGLPFNIASYALLCEMIAHVTGCTADRLILTLGDTHIYKDHIDGATEQIGRTATKAPRLVLNSEVRDIDGFTLDDITLEGYEPQAAINLRMAV